MQHLHLNVYWHLILNIPQNELLVFSHPATPKVVPWVSSTPLLSTESLTVVQSPNLLSLTPTLCSLHNLLLLCHYPQLQTYPGQCPEHSQVYKSPPRTKTLGRGFMSSHSWGRHPSIYYQTLNLHRHHLCALSPQITPRGFSPLFSVWLSKVLLILIFISVRFHLCSEKCWGYGRGSYIE